MRWKLVIVAAVACAVCIAVVTLPLGGWLGALLDWMRGSGVRGLAVYALVLAGCSLLMLPTIEVNLVGGAVYGPFWGTVACMLVCMIASALTFPIARSGRRHWIEHRLAADAKLAAIDAHIGKRALWIAFLLRLSPIIPFGPLNYALAATRISFWTYMLTTFAGMLPTMIVLVSAGAVAGDVAHPTGVWHALVIALGLAATLAATCLLGIAINRAVFSPDGASEDAARPVASPHG